MRVTYPYFTSDAPEAKINYSYSQFLGIPFIEAWKEYRMKFIYRGNGECKLQDLYNAVLDIEGNSTSSLFNKWIKLLLENESSIEGVYLLLKRFEVTKKIYEEYDSEFRPLDKRKYNDRFLYIKFALIMVLSFRITEKFQFLNVLLKVNDINCSMYDSLESREKSVLDWVISEEIRFIEDLQNINEVL